MLFTGDSRSIHPLPKMCSVEHVNKIQSQASGNKLTVGWRLSWQVTVIATSGKGCHLLGTYSVPGTTLNYLILTTTPWGRDCHTHFLQMKKLKLREKWTVTLTRGRVRRVGKTGWERGRVHLQQCSGEGMRKGFTKDGLLHWYHDSIGIYLRWHEEGSHLSKWESVVWILKIWCDSLHSSP